jgi:hypothetical protein
VKNVAGAGARWLDVSAERFPGWISSFAGRHGDSGSLGITLTDGAAAFAAEDGAVAECHPPFPESFAWPEQPISPADGAGLIAAHARVPRSVGVLLVRLGGYAAGVFTGYPPALAEAKVGVAPGARPQRGGRLVAASFRAPPGEAGERGPGRRRRRRPS